MKLKSFVSFMSVVLFAFCVNTKAPAAEPDIFQGYLKPLCLKVASMLPPSTFIAWGPMEVKLSEGTLIYSDFGLSKEYSEELLKDILADFTISGCTTYLHNNSKLNVSNYRKSVLRALYSLKIKRYAHISDESAQKLIKRLKVQYLLVGEIEEKDGVWIIKFGIGDDTIESDPLDREAKLRLIKQAVEDYERRNPPKPDKLPRQTPTTKPSATQPAPSIPAEDKSSKLAFQTEGLRPASMAFPLQSGRYIVIYPPRRNSPLASTTPAFVIFGDNKVWNITTRGGHSDTINGILLSPDKNQFYTYADDGLMIAYSTSPFKEISRLDNDSRPVKNAAFTSDGRHIVTNPGGEDSLTFDVATGTKVKSPATGIIETSAADDTLQIRNGIAGLYKDGTEPLQLIGLYDDDACPIIFNNGKSFSGIGMIERHINVIDYGKQPRLYDPSSDRRLKVDNRI